MQTLVIEHPLVSHKLTALRDERTDLLRPSVCWSKSWSHCFAVRGDPRGPRTVPVHITTPVAETEGVQAGRAEATRRADPARRASGRWRE